MYKQYWIGRICGEIWEILYPSHPIVNWKHPCKRSFEHGVPMVVCADLGEESFPWPVYLGSNQLLEPVPDFTSGLQALFAELRIFMAKRELSWNIRFIRDSLLADAETIYSDVVAMTRTELIDGFLPQESLVVAVWQLLSTLQRRMASC